MTTPAPLIVTGATAFSGPDGAIPVRKEVRDLEKNDKLQWNLYLLGLSHFEGLSEELVTSFYQIAGIHGRPYRMWDGVPGITNPEWGGYCTHTSILFLTWHRPYLALVEQTLYEIVNTLAKQFPVPLRDQYVKAAKTFRIPYWDWARKPDPGVLPPSTYISDTVTVIDVDGNSKDIPNPLYSFTFHPLNPQPGDFPPEDSPFNIWPATLRYPTDSTATSKSQNNLANDTLVSNNSNIRDALFHLFNTYHQFAPFSNDKWSPGQPRQYDSLESIHNSIHVYTGGTGNGMDNPGGHMSYSDYAGFDPIFWLHHANVDRLFAIWQGINPKSYVTPEPTESGTFTTTAGSTETPNSLLKPFYVSSDGANDNEFWTSTGAISTETFGYVYPETAGAANFSTEDNYRDFLRQQIIEQYGENTPADRIQGLVAADVAAAQKPIPAPVPAAANPGPDLNLSHVAPGGKYTEWGANIRVQKHGLDQRFSVYFFIGDFNSDPATWTYEKNFVGTYDIFRPITRTGCDKCKNDRSNEGDGTLTPREEVSDLKVSVISTEVTLPTAPGQFPVHSNEYKIHTAITEGRPGGLGASDDV
ncbi:MAG: hypothetical protein M1839_009279 [Geoglossum umbratile]|nr:MAG: hypothetical protein M1839_009279 [Geoglossum umbratile]